MVPPQSPIREVLSQQRSPAAPLSAKLLRPGLRGVGLHAPKPALPVGLAGGAPPGHAEGRRTDRLPARTLRHRPASGRPCPENPRGRVHVLYRRAEERSLPVLVPDRLPYGRVCADKVDTAFRCAAAHTTWPK